MQSAELRVQSVKSAECRVQSAELKNVGATIGRPYEEISSFICRGGYYPPALNLIYQQKREANSLPYTNINNINVVGVIHESPIFIRSLFKDDQWSPLRTYKQYYTLVGTGVLDDPLGVDVTFAGVKWHLDKPLPPSKPWLNL